MSQHTPRPRIAVCFFGITRSLRHTLPSISANILEPARQLGEVRVLAHLYPLARVDNPRSAEAADLDPEEYRLLNADVVDLEEPGACLSRWRFEQVAGFGDFWGDGFRSTRNLVHQLHSLREVTLRALDWGPDVVVFCRPDLVYFDSIRKALASFARKRTPACGVPCWQHWGGFNDRFALVRGGDLVRAYGCRIERALEFCEAGPRPLHAETFLRWCLQGRPVRSVPLRAARVRAGGRIQEDEDFGWEPIVSLERALWKSRAPRLVKRIGFRSLRIARTATDLALYGSTRNPMDDWPPNR